MALKRSNDTLSEGIKQKQVISIIVGLIKDRVSTCDESESKKQCVQERIIRAPKRVESFNFRVESWT